MTAYSPTFITSEPSCPACHGPTGDGRCINGSCSCFGLSHTLIKVLCALRDAFSSLRA